MKPFLFFIFLIAFFPAFAQQQVGGRVVGNKMPLAGASIQMAGQHLLTDSAGQFTFLVPEGKHRLSVSFTGYQQLSQWVVVDSLPKQLLIDLQPVVTDLDAVVVTGTLRPVQRMQSPIPVEVYTQKFFQKNPTPTLFESLQNINGIRPQINCSVCNTGDIHVNGLEGPYTMVTIDGMPIVSALSTVYGLFGIPTELIDRVEVVKGPASALYGSEAVGGLINIITKNPDKAPRFAANIMTTSWLEHTVDAGVRWGRGKVKALTGAHFFYNNLPFDKNKDGFADVTLQQRASLFQKLTWARNSNRTASLAGRYFYEDRWGGQMQWQPKFRGGDSVYGESIYTNRWELLGNYQLPTTENIHFQFSATGHRQNSFYGVTPYLATQRILFGQMLWRKQLRSVHLLTGITARHTFYNDNTAATFDDDGVTDKPERIFLPGAFVQGEWTVTGKSELLTGLRYDHHPVHGGIITPRIAYKYAASANTTLRLNTGTGFRVVNLFTEDHAALTGARIVEIAGQLNPERSVNANANISHKLAIGSSRFLVDASAWYTHFSNRIFPDYNTDPNKIIYRNLNGFSVSRGVSLNMEGTIRQRLKIIAGATLQNVFLQEEKQRTQQPLTESWSGTWVISYNFPAAGIAIDYTGNVYGPMQLPLLSQLDPRKSQSPVWSIQNIQLTKTVKAGLEIYGGAKNLLNWTPAKGNPFLIARANDPFDKQVLFNADGTVQPNNDPNAGAAYNPYALSFDPTYMYASNQGIRFFAGLRYSVR